MKKLVTVASAAVVLLLVNLWPTQPRFWKPGPLVELKRFGDYEVRIYQRHDENLLEEICDKLPAFLSDFGHRIPGLTEWAGVEILRDHRRVYCAYGSNPMIAEFGSNSVAGLDITGDGIPKIALTDENTRSGGSLVVFECGASFRKIAEINSSGTYPELRDLDGDDVPELIVSDDAFYHWPVCRDGEPMPEVILRWRNGKYVAAKDLMYKPTPATEELEATAAVIRSSPAWNTEYAKVPSELWTNAIALMYSGHERLGWEFVDKAWPPGFAGKGELSSKKELIDYYLWSRLEESVYAPDIMTTAHSPKNPP